MEDLISRQAVLEQINCWIGSGEYRYAMSERFLIDRIKTLSSSVNPQEPKTGHWIENAPEYQNIDPPYICSECGNMHLRKTNYCDQCGCRMFEPQESEDKE